MTLLDRIQAHARVIERERTQRSRDCEDVLDAAARRFGYGSYAIAQAAISAGWP